jgi:hypothetical protein
VRQKQVIYWPNFVTRRRKKKILVLSLSVWSRTLKGENKGKNTKLD